MDNISRVKIYDRNIHEYSVRALFVIILATIPNMSVSLSACWMMSYKVENLQGVNMQHKQRVR